MRINRYFSAISLLSLLFIATESSAIDIPPNLANSEWVTPKGLEGAYIARIPIEVQGKILVMISYPYKDPLSARSGLYAFNPATKTWEMQGKTWPGAHAMSNHYSSQIYSNSKGEIFAYYSPLKKFRRFTTEGWVDVASTGPAASLDTDTGVIRGDKVYMQGYETVSGVSVFSVYVYDTLNDKWEAKVDTATAPLGPRRSFTVDRDGDFILAGAGNSGPLCVKDGVNPWPGCMGIAKVPSTGGLPIDLDTGTYNGNATNGKCCAQDFYITANADGSRLFAQNWRDSYLFDYLDNNWKIFEQGSYGNGPPMPHAVGDNGIVTSQKYFDTADSFYYLGKNNKKIPTGFAILDNDSEIVTNIKNIISFDQGKTFFALYNFQGTKKTVLLNPSDPNSKWNGGITFLELDPLGAKHTISFKPKISTYLGGVGHDEVIGTGILNSGNETKVVIAGNFAGGTPIISDSPTITLGASATSRARIAVINPTMTESLEIILGNRILDIDVNKANSSIAAIGDFGVFVTTYANSLGSFKFIPASSLPGLTALAAEGKDRSMDSARVALTDDQKIVTLVANTLTLWSQTGEKISERTIGKTHFTDLAVLPDGIFVSGFQQYTSVLSGVPQKAYPVQVAFVHKYSLGTLDFVDKTWDYASQAVGDSANMADTRAYRLKVGEDGKLYVAGESAGGNTIYRWNGKDLSTPTLVSVDPYTDAWNTASAHLGYHAIIDPQTMTVIRGQTIVPRLPSNNLGNTFRTRAVTADHLGTVYVGGTSACCSRGRSALRMFDQALPPYLGGESSLLIMDASLKFAQRWTAFVHPESKGLFNINGVVKENPTGDNGEIVDIATDNGLKVLVGNAPQGKIFTSNGALHPTPYDPDGNDNASDAYMMIWE